MSTLERDVGDLKPRAVEFTATELVVTLMDGRKIVTPLAWYPRLLGASAAQRAAPLIVQWEAAQEGRAALYTGIIRCQRFRLGQASAANRYTPKISQGLIADSAIVGEK